MARYLSLFNALLLTFFIGQRIITISSARETGVYVRNELNQSTMERWLSPEEKTALEYRILRLLGLPEKPKNPEKRPIMKRSAPKFLLDVYTNDVEQKPWNNKGEFKLTELSFYTINQSDVIISFMAQQPHQGLGGKPDRVKRIWFDVSGVPVDDDIVMSAELRLYRGPNPNNNNKKNRGPFVVTIYRVLRNEDDSKDFHFVDSVNLTGDYIGWITLNVSESLNFWTKNPEENRGFYISVVSASDQSSRKIKPENIGIIGFKGDEEKQPFMAGFYRNSGNKNIQLRINDIVMRYPRSADNNSLEILQNRYVKEQVKSSGSPCSMRTLYVNFKDIQWQDWIIAPSGFDAFYCGGDCHFPLPTRMNATNHAIIQTLMHLKRPDKVPKPCCAPTKHSAISVLYFHDENNVVLKKYKNMVVERCGCL